MAPLLLCDLDNTLIDRTAGFRIWATRFLAGHGIEGDGELDWLVAEDRDGLRDRLELFEAFRARHGMAEPADRMRAAYRREYPACQPPPDAATLAALRSVRARGWGVAVVTNGHSSQRAKIAHAGLRPLVDAVCVSTELGCRKPEPGIFEAAAAACGGQLAGAWMVGDSPEADVAGAAACGLRSVWLRRGRRWPGGGVSPTFEADTFAAAVELILSVRDLSE